MIHPGWDEPSDLKERVTYAENGNVHTRALPVIKRRRRATPGMPWRSSATRGADSSC